MRTASLFRDDRFRHTTVFIFIIYLIAILAGALVVGESAQAASKAKEEAGRLGPALHRIVRAYERGGPIEAAGLAAREGIAISTRGGEPRLTVILEPAGAVHAGGTGRIEGIGAEIDAVSRSFVRVRVPVGLVRRLAALPEVRLLRLPIPRIGLDAGFGTIVSEGVTLTGADLPQEAGFDGAGVKIAVVDLGFVGLTNAQAAGEIPASAHRVKGNLEGAAIEIGTPHGTGVAEHVMDMAPGAELYCIMIEDEVDLENAADYIRDNDIRIANHSVGWVNASYYDDTGPISAIVNDSHDADGVFWAVAAGNAARRHWRGGWTDTDGDSLLEFDGSDESIDILGSYATAYVFLNWDQYGDSRTDLDLTVHDRTGAVVASSEGPQTGPQHPAEGVGFPYSTAMKPYTIEVRWYSGPTDDLDITIFSFHHDIQYASAASSMMEPADAHGSFSAGAVNRINWNDPEPPPEYFSSQGPTTDGRPKPDIAAPDATASFTYGTSVGTSFASPTTAGAAALVLALEPDFTVAGLADALRTAAIDIGIAGSDSVFGAGKLNIQFSLDSLPEIASIIDVPGDQGLAVNVTWERSGYDFPDSPRQVISYEIYRRPLTGGWEGVLTVPADGSTLYAAVVPTEKDSTHTDGMYYSSFFVRASTAAALFYDSPPDSGFSVDDIAPGRPADIVVDCTGDAGNLLSWRPSTAPDLSGYLIYRGGSDDFAPAPDNLLHATTDTSWVDGDGTGASCYYKITAVDDAGNESDYAAPLCCTTDAVAAPAAGVLLQNFPNPFNPTTVIRYVVAERGRVTLGVYNAGGVLVRSLVDSVKSAGPHDAVWDGRDTSGRAAASGVYFYKLVAPGFEGSRKMILLR